MAGFWDRLLSSRVGTAFFQPRVTYLGAGETGALLGDFEGMTAAQMWRTQPNLRTVVSFRARNVAQLGLHVFERASDTDRHRDHSTPLAKALRRPDPAALMTRYDLIFATIGDIDLYDRAYWLIIDEYENGSPVKRLRRLPPAWVEPVMSSDGWTVEAYKVVRGDRQVRVSADQVLPFTGYAPESPVKASPTVEALKATLREQIEAAQYRAQVWKRGGRVSAVLERPTGAPEWSDKAREAFREDWYAKYTGAGSKAGGTPLLEDGMSLKRIDFSAKDQEYVEAAKLALATIASAFHVNPMMVGLLDNANYSNVREFHRQLYTDTLGPTLAQIEDRINAYLLPMLDMDPERHYAEFNIGEKLQGSFEERAAVLSSSVGAPWMTRNEARALDNLPAIEGGDQLITPLNVLEGGQASSRDSGDQNVTGAGRERELSAPRKPRKAEPLKIKGQGRDADSDEAAEVLRKFFRRQRSEVLTELGSKSETWWDEDRWNSELAADLLALARRVVTEVGADTLEEIGIPAEFSEDRVENFLAAVAESRAGAINAITQRAILRALNGDIDDDAEQSDPAGVFDVAEASRAERGGQTFATTLAGIAVIEAGRQAGRGGVTKTWQTTSGNPRPSHAAMNGDTVPVDEPFTNGMEWPGDKASGAGPEEIAMCSCIVVVNVP